MHVMWFDFEQDAASKLPADKPVERDDAARVVRAEISNKENARTTRAGVAAAMAAAARLNEGIEKTIWNMFLAVGFCVYV